jgi:diguanylate cyclase (GGDEF)-like protein
VPDTPNPADVHPAEWTAGTPESMPSGPPAEWWLDRSLAERLYGLVDRHDLSSGTFAELLADTVATYGDAAYAELIFLLTRLRLEPADAVRHWPGVLRRQAQIGNQAGGPADVRVALLSYFLDVERQFKRPKVVEMSWAEWTAASALLDDVTGLPNQRFFRAEFRREIERSLRDNSPLSLIVLDTDDFKRVNDLLGHDAGTAALVGLARVLRENSRACDLVVRYGGDEFVVLLPTTPKTDAAQVAEILRLAAPSYLIQPADGSPPLSLTFSLGVATCPGDACDEPTLFTAADRALYDAKKAGKNRVCLFGESTRSYARRRVVWPARVHPAGATGSEVMTHEVGEGGFSFHWDGDLPVGTIIDALITMPDGDVLRRAGRVVWSRAEASAEGREIAVRFVEPGGDDRAKLAQWVRSK